MKSSDIAKLIMHGTADGSLNAYTNMHTSSSSDPYFSVPKHLDQEIASSPDPYFSVPKHLDQEILFLDLDVFGQMYSSRYYSAVWDLRDIRVLYILFWFGFSVIAVEHTWFKAIEENMIYLVGSVLL